MAAKSEKTRNQLIEVASLLFYEKGFEQTTFKDIATQVGVTQPLLYSYFRNKMGLLSECCLAAGASGREQIYKFLKPQDTASKNIYQYLLGNLVWFESDKVRAHTILSMYYFAGSDPEIRKIYHLAEASALTKIQEILDKGKREKEWSGAKSKDLAPFIHNLLIGAIFKQFYPSVPITPEAQAAALSKVCLRLLKSSL